MSSNDLISEKELRDSLKRLEENFIDKGYKKVPVDVLQPRMRVTSPEIIEKNIASEAAKFFLISGPEDIEKLKENKIAYVWAQTEEIPADLESTLLIQEIQNSSSFYTDSRDMMQTLLDGARAGESVTIENVEPVVDKIVSSVSRHPSALLCMKSLQDSQQYTYYHSINVALIASVFAHFLGYSPTQIKEITIAGLLHDLGKQKVPIEILDAPRKLTPNEFKIMQNHPSYAIEMLKQGSEISTDILAAVAQHHERCNGTGYPLGLNADEIHPYASVISLADVYDALTSERVYKKAMPQNKTASYIFSQRGIAFPAEMTDLFICCFGVYPIGTLVKISATQFALVCENNKDDLLHPKVLEIIKQNGQYTFASLEPIDLRFTKDKYKIQSCENVKWGLIQIKDLLLNAYKKAKTSDS